MATRTLTYVLIGKDASLTAAVKKAGVNVEETGGVMSGAMAKVAKTFALMAVVGAGASVKLAVDFQTSMQKIVGLVGVSQAQVNVWSQQILALSQTLPQSPKQLADALFYVTSAGFRGAAAMNVLRIAARAATAGLGPTATITDVLTSALKAYQGTGLTAVQITDSMVAAVRTGKIPVDELAGSIGQVIPLAAQAGVSFQQVVGVAASLSHVGVAVDKSMTGLRFLLTNLIKPTAGAEKLLKQFGMTAQELRDQVANKGLLWVLQELKNKMPIQDFLKMVGGARGLTVGLGLVGKNASQVVNIMSQVKNSAGSTDAAFAVAAQTAKFKLGTALSSLEADGITLGSTLLPLLANAASLFTKLLAPIGRSPAAFLAAGLGVIGFAAAFKIAMAMVTDSIKGALLTSGIGVLILAIGIGIAELMIHWKTVWTTISNITRTVSAAVTGFLSGMWIWIKGHWPLLLGILAGPFAIAAGEIIQHWSQIWNFIQSTLQPIFAIFNRIKSFVTTSFDGWWKVNGQALIDIWNVVWNVIRTIFNFVWGQITQNARAGWHLFQGVFTVGFGIINAIVKTAWKIISALFQVNLIFIEFLFKTFWLVITTAWNVAFAIIKSILKVQWTIISNLFKLAFDVIVGLFGVFINLITGRWGAAWTDLKNLANQAWNILKNIFHAAMNAIISALGSSLNQVVAFFTKLPGRFITAMGNAGKILVNVGGQVVSGLFNGIKGALSSIGNWVQNNIFNPIVNAVKHLFGINSPSTVMAGIGGHLISGLILGILKTNPSKFISKVFGDLPTALGALVEKGLVNIAKLPAKALKALGGIGSKIGGFFSKLFGGGTAGAGVQQWRSLVSEALKMEGLSQQLVDPILYQMQTESGGNVNAINLTDSNAQAGDPSRGLMQVIGTTFAAYHWPGTSFNIYDPLANIAAAINYAKHTYGPGLRTAYGGIGTGHGYSAGTPSAKRGWAWVGEKGRELVNFRGGEQVIANNRLGSAHQTIWTGDVIVKGHALASKQELAKTVTEAIAYSGRHGNH